ncbi:class I SAM-dependent methyltransferase [Caballeronia udeis]|nr:class I SAM-dependent methyltransferase [Caballeronia udeis]
MALTIRQSFDCHQSGPFHFPSGFSIYNAESNGALHHQLHATSQYTCSEYFGDDVERGSEVNGVLHQDLQALTFTDNQFDAVLSSDVFEHMPRPYDAHREVFRVLKPGGRHIFTVPFAPHYPRDDVRAAIVDGKIVYYGEKYFHGDPVRPDQGVLVWTIFGLQMLDELERIGFKVTFENLYAPDSGIVGPASIVFSAQKPSSVGIIASRRPEGRIHTLDGSAHSDPA